MLTKIILNNLCKKYNTGSIINDVSAEFQQNKSYAIIGVSGSGKSTLLTLIAGLEKPTNGAIFFNKQNINDYSSKERSYFHSLDIGLVLQTPHLIQDVTILENVMLPALIAGNSWQESSIKAQEMLNKVGIPDKANHIPFQLSGGEQQRATLARALINNPSFLLADELTGNLDKKTGNSIIELLLQCKKEYKTGLIITTHDHLLASKMDVVYELRNGQLHEQKNSLLPETTRVNSLTI